MEDTILYVIILALMGYWCYRIAERKGRSPILAAFWGALLGILGVIIYYALPTTEEVKIKNAKKLLEEKGEKVE